MSLPDSPLTMAAIENPLIATIEGNRFRCYVPFTLAGTVGATFKYVVRIPSSPIIVTLDRVWTCDIGGATLQVMASPTTLVAGTQFPNRNLNGLYSSHTSAVEIRAYTSAASDGTEVDYDICPGAGAATPARSAGPITYGGGSRVYPPGSAYVIILTNKTSTANFGVVKYEWIEAHCMSDFIGA